jgi:hypothetical protein
MSQSKGCCDG